VNTLLFCPMRVQFRDILIPFWRECRMPIRDRCFALQLAVGNYLDFDLVSREARHHEHVLHPAGFSVIGRDQPNSLLAIGACGSKHDALALRSLGWVNETRSPGGCPFRLAHRPEKRRHISDRSFQHNRERLRPLFQCRRSGSTSRRTLNQHQTASQDHQNSLHYITVSEYPKASSQLSVRLDFRAIRLRSCTASVADKTVLDY